MARVYLLSQHNTVIKLIYTVDKAVGAGCPNLRDDVALVQFLLRAVLEDGESFQVPAGAPLSIDGICGPQTILYIKSWQQQERQLDMKDGAKPGTPMQPQDGVISPMLVRSGIGSLSHYRYSILSLNVQYGLTKGIEKHANIASDPRCPQALLPSIFWQ
jgi:hypothetical protein